MCQLLNEDKKLITVSPPIYNTSPFVVFTLYQDRHILSWFHDHYREPLFYNDQKYQLLKFVSDVIEYETELVEAIMDLAVKKDANSVIDAFLGKVIRQDEFLDMDCGPKGIILILIEDGGDNENP